jgi:TetR/AcrR family transcriptional repressor of nem operon
VHEHTGRGLATRERIVAAAAALVGERGVAAISLDDVRAATQTSKSQLYHYFGGKQGLVEAVVQHTSEIVLTKHAQALNAVETWDDLDRWCEMMVGLMEAQGMRGGCPVGTLAAALADTDDRSREWLANAFRSWEEYIGGALRRLRNNGLLRPDADLDVLTTRTLAAVQGGLLLAKTMRSGEPLRASLQGAVEQLRQYTPA